MHCSKSARTFKRSYSIDQPPNCSSVSLQLSSQQRNGISCIPNFAVPSNHVVSQNRPAIETQPNGELIAFSTINFNQGEAQIGAMSRTELEIFAQMKTFETNMYKNRFKELEKHCSLLQNDSNVKKHFETKCINLQSSLDELTNLYEQQDKMHDGLKRACSQFIRDLQRGPLNGGGAAWDHPFNGVR